MLDINKKYKTRSGKRVINLMYNPFNSNGDVVTYPLKGTVIISEDPWKTMYCIWSEDGLYNKTCPDINRGLDLVEA